MTPSEQPRYRLTLRSELSSVPAPVRLRRLLKHVLRLFHFRCEALEECDGASELPNCCGKRVQVLMVKPDLVVALLRSLSGHCRLSVPVAYSNRDELKDARVMACREIEGVVWLYLEGPDWPVVPDGCVPCARFMYVELDGRPQLTNEWTSTKAAQVADGQA